MRRRNVIGGLVGGVAAAAVAVTAGLYRFTDLIVKHYPPTPYDDVLVQLVDREQAAKLGAKVAGSDAKTLAAQVRGLLGHGGLGRAALADAAAGRTSEVDGWVLPQSVALLAALAAKV